MILVVGATGALGMEICRRLKNGGASVKGLVRPPSQKQPELESIGVEIAHGDLKDSSSIEAACHGADCVVSTANAMMSRRSGDSLKRVDRDGQLGLVTAAEKAGVGHFVFVSVTPNGVECAFFDYKRQVERALRESKMTWTILQPGGFMETAFSPIAGWDMKKGRVRIVGAGLTPATMISMYDVAEFAVMATDTPGMRNRTLPLGGPEPVTAMDAVKVFENVTGKKIKVDRAPPAVLKIASYLLRPFSPPLSTILTLAGSQKPDIIDMTPVVSEFPVKLTSLREFAERSVKGQR